MQHLHFFEPKRKIKSPPLVFFLHSATGHARMYYADMLALSKEGIPSVALEAPYARSRDVLQPRGLASPANERCLWDRTKEELSMGLDEAISFYQCDRERIGFVGLNLGGSMGAYWLAKGAPVKAAVISGAVPDLTDFWLGSSHPVAISLREEGNPDPQGYRSRMAETDLIETIPKISRNTDLLLQFGRQDPWITPESFAIAERTFSSLPNVTIASVDDDHEMKSLGTLNQRVNFLTERLSN